MACSSLLSDDDLRRFRTKPCRRNHQQAGRCEFGPDRCQYSHSESWPRRCPFYLSHSTSIRYIPRICPNVTLGEGNDPALRTIGTVLSNKCTRGGACPFAHSLEEVLYHPLHYKTKVCPLFLRGECTTYYCPFIHGTAERREASGIKYNLPFSNGVFKTSPFPNVEITSKIPPVFARSQQSQHYCLNNGSNNGSSSLSVPSPKILQSKSYLLSSSSSTQLPLDHPFEESLQSSTNSIPSLSSTQSLSSPCLLFDSPPFPNSWTSLQGNSEWDPTATTTALTSSPASCHVQIPSSPLLVSVSNEKKKSLLTRIEEGPLCHQLPNSLLIQPRDRSPSHTKDLTLSDSDAEDKDLNQSIRSLLVALMGENDNHGHLQAPSSELLLTQSSSDDNQCNNITRNTYSIQQAATLCTSPTNEDPTGWNAVHCPASPPVVQYCSVAFPLLPSHHPTNSHSHTLNASTALKGKEETPQAVMIGKAVVNECPIEQQQHHNSHPSYGHGDGIAGDAVEIGAGPSLCLSVPCSVSRSHRYKSDAELKRQETRAIEPSVETSHHVSGEGGEGVQCVHPAAPTCCSVSPSLLPWSNICKGDTSDESAGKKTSKKSSVVIGRSKTSGDRTHKSPASQLQQQNPWDDGKSTIVSKNRDPDTLEGRDSLVSPSREIKSARLLESEVKRQLVLLVQAIEEMSDVKQNDTSYSKNQNSCERRSDEENKLRITLDNNELSEKKQERRFSQWNEIRNQFYKIFYLMNL